MPNRPRNKTVRHISPPGSLRAATWALACVLAACTAPGAEQPEVADQVDPTVAEVDDAVALPEPSTTEPDGDASAPTAPEPTVSPAPPSASVSVEPDMPVIDPAEVTLALEPFADMDAPIAMAIRPGDPMVYIAERAGTVRPVSPDGTVGAPIIDISDLTTTSGERGLLGLTWSTDGNTLYLSFTDTDGANVLQGIDVVDGVLQSPTSRRILRVDQPASNHNGGDVHVGPDGYVWWALGDGGAADDRFGNGQRADTLLATLLRIDPSGADPYAIPRDNPFVDGGGAAEVWAYGLRNPWRFSFDAETGELWVADVGQNAVEEVNRVSATAAGLNYGWPRTEGDRPFDGQPLAGPSVDPVHTYDHSRGCSITGGRVYRGHELDSRLRGAYLYGDFCAGDVFALAVDSGGRVTADVDTGLDVPNLVSFGEDGDGELYVLSLDGPVMKVVSG